jgi:hypothetical protein
MTRLDMLRSPVFLISIGIMVLNDFVLKATFHNWLTGKLSDFAGLTALTLFGYAMWPKERRSVGMAVATIFTFWKSPYSQGLIEFANSYLPFQVGRVIDYTDLLALSMVWWASKYAPTFKKLEMRQISVFGIAGLSLVAFTGTTIIDNHIIRQTAVVPQTTSATKASIEDELQKMLDGIAEKRNMHCIICDPLSKGRVYVVTEENSLNLSLTTSFDLLRSSLLYDVRTTSIGGKLKTKKEVDELIAELREVLQKNFPSIEITSTSYPSSKQVGLGVWKKEPFTSYQDKPNQVDYNVALGIVAKQAANMGMYQISESMYGAGRLFGPSPYDRDFVVSVGIADDPLVVISIYCHSSECVEQQRLLANELEQKLREVFGKDRASIR